MLEQVRGKVTPQRVQRDGLVDLGHLCRGMTGAVELACRERLHRIAPGKQPVLWLRHLPLGPQQIEEMLRQHHVSVLTNPILLPLSCRRSCSPRFQRECSGAPALERWCGGLEGICGGKVTRVKLRS